jgi:hypothetical protein
MRSGLPQGVLRELFCENLKSRYMVCLNTNRFETTTLKIERRGSCNTTWTLFQGLTEVPSHNVRPVGGHSRPDLPAGSDLAAYGAVRNSYHYHNSVVYPLDFVPRRRLCCPQCIDFQAWIRQKQDRTAWGIQGGNKAAAGRLPYERPPLKRLSGRFRNGHL